MPPTRDRSSTVQRVNGPTDARGYTRHATATQKSEAEHFARWMRRGGFSVTIRGRRGAWEVWVK